MGEFADHSNKIIIRNYWCKPIIKHIHETIGKKLVYLGLPGLEAIDLLEWIEHITYVIAIDCGDYSIDKYDLTIAQEKIKKLNGILNLLDRKGDISGYSLYLGFLEEVVLKGFDKNGQKFTLNDTINIYNLDFCNSLTAPFKIVDLQGVVTKYYKNEVIRKLLEYERDIIRPDSEKRFIMFITVHTNFWEDEAETYFKVKKDSEFESYKVFIRGLNESERIVRLLRFYFIDILKLHFTSSSFIPYFLPTILYQGKGKDNNLMCFTVVGKYIKQPSAIAPFHQNINALIHQKFLFPANNKLNFLISSIVERNPSVDPIQGLNESLLFDKR
jgi:hypothetical protein